MTRRPLLDRIIDKVDARDPEECWPWTGAMYRKTPRVEDTERRRPVDAARQYWIEVNGPLSQKQRIGRACDNDSCMNPAHMQIDAKGSHGGAPKGEKHARAHLKALDIPEIRRRVAARETYQAIAEDYAVTTGAISSIVKGRSWKHVV
jgi:hypothetical protein